MSNSDQLTNYKAGLKVFIEAQNTKAKHADSLIQGSYADKAPTWFHLERDQANQAAQIAEDFNDLINLVQNTIEYLEFPDKRRVLTHAELSVKNTLTQALNKLTSPKSASKVEGGT